MNTMNDNLTPDEKAAMRSRLAAFAAAHRSGGARAFFMRHAAAYTMGATLLAGMGTATGFAQQSLPGDFLYPVRVAVNERVAVALTGDEDARLTREADQLALAIDESEQVSADALAELAVTGDVPDEQSGEPTDEEAGGLEGRDAQPEDGSDAELEAELRDMERLLTDAEAAADLELSL